MRRVHLLIVMSLSLIGTTLNAFEVLCEARTAYFLPENHKFRKIYSGGWTYGGEISAELNRNIYTWLSVDHFSKHGHSLGCTGYHTRVCMMPISLGLKYFYHLPDCQIDLYGAFGITSTSINLHDRSPYAVNNSNKSGLGWIAKMGAIYNYDSFFLNTFINYSYSPFDFHQNHHGKVYRNSTDLSGWSFGIGIGYRFNI